MAKDEQAKDIDKQQLKRWKDTQKEGLHSTELKGIGSIMAAKVYRGPCARWGAGGAWEIFVTSLNFL